MGVSGKSGCFCGSRCKNPMGRWLLCGAPLFFLIRLPMSTPHSSVLVSRVFGLQGVPISSLNIFGNPQ